jgi:glucose/arabinose dehydrogenase
MLKPPSVSILGAALILGACAAGRAEPVAGPAPQGVEDAYVPDPAGYRAVPWVEDLEAPWSLVFLPDGRALVSERPGRIRLIRDGELAAAPYAELETIAGATGLLELAVQFFAGGEGGLMGLAVHPAFPAEPYVYAMHTYRADDGTTANRVIRLVDEGERASLDRVIIDGIPSAVVHNGGRVAFGPDGMLYVATGDAREPRLSQDPDSLAGKILRLTPEGLGLRNPQGLAWHPETGDLFASEHGPSGEFGLRAYDEVNVIEPGGNYGRPEKVGAPGLEPYIDPIVVWPEVAVPPAGVAFYDGDLFVSMLGQGALIRVGLAHEGEAYRVERIERWFAEGPRTGVFGRIRDAVLGPDGRLYFLTSNRDGRGDPRPGDDKIFRLEPTGG